MRKVLILLLIVILVLSGCFFWSPGPYPFCQDFEQIASIEILKKDDSIYVNTPMSVMKTLDATEYQDMIDALLAADGGRQGLDPGQGFGHYIIRITYKNGGAEMIGNYNNGYISPEGVLRHDCYCFEREQFYAIISRFLGEEIVEPTLG